VVDCLASKRNALRSNPRAAVLVTEPGAWGTLKRLCTGELQPSPNMYILFLIVKLLTI
jgi:hypothetical protein